MSDPDTKERRSRSRKKKMYTKKLYDPNEFKGAFAIAESKSEYRRERMRVNEVNVNEDED